MTPPESPYLFVSCQVGAEAPLKSELAKNYPDFRFAFSRPGFVTFKRASEGAVPEDFELRSVFARTYGVSHGRVQGELAEGLVEHALANPAVSAIDHVHVWERDKQIPGEQEFEPGETPLASEVGKMLATAIDARDSDSKQTTPVNQTARVGQRVLDCVLVEPGQWWLGTHCVSRFSSRHVGGVPRVDAPDDMVSRAYLKMVESVQWSRFPLRRGDLCVEIGSSPGGSCQALLDMGMSVTGVDPAEMDPLLLENDNFQHVRKRGAEVRRREYAPFRWLMADSNVAPKHTLDTVESIVTHDAVRLKGLLLTLKMSNWKLAEKIPEFVKRVQGWGYEYVKVRQLAFNRREVCLAALRRRSMLRERPWKRQQL